MTSVWVCLFKAISFDFRSTNVGSSVIGTHSFWCHYPLITYLSENSVTQNNFKYKVNKVYFSYLFPVVVQSNVFSIVTDSWMKVVKSALSWFLTVRGESKTQAENLKPRPKFFVCAFSVAGLGGPNFWTFPITIETSMIGLWAIQKLRRLIRGEAPKKLIINHRAWSV